ncbi:MAG: DJ-1/PfpI family protein [Gemmataceae bacterium]|nr:DJ-1/PfpI family protein [Gemmataceae bacterium]
MNALILAANGFEDLELFYPWFRLREEGFEVHVAGANLEPLTGAHGYKVHPDLSVEEINEPAWDLLIIPGGTGIDALAENPTALTLVRTFLKDERRVVALGKGVQLLARAGMVAKRRIACTQSLVGEMTKAGARAKIDTVIFDGNLITCQGPAWLPELTSQLLASFGLKA